MLRRTEEVLARRGLINIDAQVLEIAASLQPARLGSPDAVHLGMALSLGEQLGAVVSCDVRLTEAAEANGVSALASE